MRSLAFATVLLAVGGNAFADEATDKAKAAFTRGMAHFHLDEYEQAIPDFQEAYRNKPDPVFLYNVAQAARLGKKTEMAIDYYEKYLRLAEHPANEKKIRAQLEALRKLQRAQQSALDAKPHSTLAPDDDERPTTKKSASTTRSASTTQPTSPEEPRPSVAKDPEPSSQPVAQQPEAPPADEPRPVYKKWWFWTGVVLLAAVVAGAVVLGVELGGSSGPALPATDYGPINLGLRFR